jgi:hypothetical protein
VKPFLGRVWLVSEKVPKMSEIPTDVDVPQNGFVDVVFDPNADVGIIIGEKYTTYAFPVRLNDGKDSILKGGKKLLSAMQSATRGANLPMKLRIRVAGRGGLNVSWDVAPVA